MERSSASADGRAQHTPSEPASPAEPRRPPVSSEQLLQGRRVVEIAHNGEVYRLQATRLGKLILTK